MLPAGVPLLHQQDMMDDGYRAFPQSSSLMGAEEPFYGGLEGGPAYLEDTPVGGYSDQPGGEGHLQDEDEEDDEEDEEDDENDDEDDEDDEVEEEDMNAPRGRRVIKKKKIFDPTAKAPQLLRKQKRQSDDKDNYNQRGHKQNRDKMRKDGREERGKKRRRADSAPLSTSGGGPLAPHTPSPKRQVPLGPPPTTIKALLMQEGASEWKIDLVLSRRYVLLHSHQDE